MDLRARTDEIRKILRKTYPEVKTQLFYETPFQPSTHFFRQANLYGAKTQVFDLPACGPVPVAGKD